MARGTIDQILAVLAHEISLTGEYEFSDGLTLGGADLLEHLQLVRDDSDSPHSFVENLEFTLRGSGGLDKYRIARITPGARAPRFVS